MTDCELAVKLYHRSSLLSFAPQEGSGKEWVAPVVLADTDAAQLVPKGWGVMAIALLHSSLAGGAVTACTQKSKFISRVVLVLGDHILV